MNFVAAIAGLIAYPESQVERSRRGIAVATVTLHVGAFKTGTSFIQSGTGQATRTRWLLRVSCGRVRSGATRSRLHKDCFARRTAT